MAFCILVMPGPDVQIIFSARMAVVIISGFKYVFFIVL